MIWICLPLVSLVIAGIVVLTWRHDLFQQVDDLESRVHRFSQLGRDAPMPPPRPRCRDVPWPVGSDPVQLHDDLEGTTQDVRNSRVLGIDEKMRLFKNLAALPSQVDEVAMLEDCAQYCARGTTYDAASHECQHDTYVAQLEGLEADLRQMRERVRDTLPTMVENRDVFFPPQMT
jgi:hypothetical protein